MNLIKYLCISLVFIYSMNATAASKAEEGSTSGSGNMSDGMMSTAGAMSGSAMSTTMVGISYLGKCSSHNYWACVAGIMTLMQASEVNKGANNTYEQAKNIIGPDFNVPNFPGAGCDSNSALCIPSPSGDNTTIMDPKTIEDLIKKKSNLDVNMNAGTITDPNGNTITTDSLNTPSGMSSAAKSLGASASDISGLKDLELGALPGAKKKGKEIEAKFKKAISSISGGGSGSSSRRSMAAIDGASDDGLSDIDYAAFFKSKDKGDKDFLKDKKTLIGNNEAIGVSADNIFDMVKRRYNSLNAVNSFVKK